MYIIMTSQGVFEALTHEISKRDNFNLPDNVKLIFTLPIVMLVYFEQTEERPVFQTTRIGQS